MARLCVFCGSNVVEYLGPSKTASMVKLLCHACNQEMEVSAKSLLEEKGIAVTEEELKGDKNARIPEGD